MKLILSCASVLLLLSISACSTTSARLDSPASDLEVLESRVKENAPRRTLPNGKLYCGELSTTEGAQDECIADLEFLVYSLAGDIRRVVGLVEDGARRLKLARDPCGKIEAIFARKRCRGDE